MNPALFIAAATATVTAMSGCGPRPRACVRDHRTAGSQLAVTAGADLATVGSCPS